MVQSRNHKNRIKYTLRIVVWPLPYKALFFPDDCSFGVLFIRVYSPTFYVLLLFYAILPIYRFVTYPPLLIIISLDSSFRCSVGPLAVSVFETNLISGQKTTGFSSLSSSSMVLFLYSVPLRTSHSR